MKKNLILIIALFSILTSQVQAQSDSISLFRAPGKSGVKNNTNSAGNNLISFSLGYFSRGGTILSYERLLGNSGISLYAGAGISALDFLGQYSIFIDRPILLDGVTKISSFDIGSIFDFGAKYYFEKQTGGFFLGAGFTQINNSVYAGVSENIGYGFSESKPINLGYTCNEIKFFVGSVNDQESRFYNEFSIGPKIKILNYDQVSSELVTTNLESKYVYSKNNKDELKFGIFIGWKMGVRF